MTRSIRVKLGNLEQTPERKAPFLLEIRKNKKMECFIIYRDSKNNFKETKKDFKTYENAYNWMVQNFEKVNRDFIHYY